MCLTLAAWQHSTLLTEATLTAARPQRCPQLTIGRLPKCLSPPLPPSLPPERPNDIPEGETPHAVSLYVFESNVDVCRPGDRVTITGTYRAVPMRVNPRQRALHALYKVRAASP